MFYIYITPYSRNESKHFPTSGSTVQFLKYLSPRPLFFNSDHNSTGAVMDVKYSFIGDGIFLHYSM